MDMTPVTEEELRKVIKKLKPSSAPSPVDKISYQNFNLYMTLSGTFSTGLSWKGKYPPPGEWQS